jgi:threonine dehydrogenase-like Zn-dependent dehydrogenase
LRISAESPAIYKRPSHLVKAIAVFPQERELKLIEVDPPNITEPHQVKLKMLEVGVCGTDREICSFAYGSPPPGSNYLVIGHESLGEVVTVGSAVEGIKPGDLIVTSVRRPCPHPDCRACTAGRPDFCYTGDFSERGIKGMHGYMTEVIVDDCRNMNVAPAALRDVAVMVEPLTIAEKALTELWSVQQRLPWNCPHAGSEGIGHCHSALALGAGPVGLLGAMALRRRGFDTYVYSRESADSMKARIANAIGAHYISAIDTSIGELPSIMDGIDVVYEATGASRLAFEVAEQVGVNGVFIFTGVPGRKHPVDLDTDLLMRNLVLKNQILLGSVNASRPNFQDALADLSWFNAHWPDTVRSLITGRHSMASYAELLHGNPSGIKNVLKISP